MKPKFFAIFMGNCLQKEINSVLEEAGNLSEKIERLTYALKN